MDPDNSHKNKFRARPNQPRRRRRHSCPYSVVGTVRASRRLHPTDRSSTPHRSVAHPSPIRRPDPSSIGRPPLAPIGRPHPTDPASSFPLYRLQVRAKCAKMQADVTKTQPKSAGTCTACSFSMANFIFDGAYQMMKNQGSVAPGGNVIWEEDDLNTKTRVADEMLKNLFQPRPQEGFWFPSLKYPSGRGSNKKIENGWDTVINNGVSVSCPPIDRIASRSIFYWIRSVPPRAPIGRFHTSTDPTDRSFRSHCQGELRGRSAGDAIKDHNPLCAPGRGS